MYCEIFDNLFFSFFFSALYSDVEVSIAYDVANIPDIYPVTHQYIQNCRQSFVDRIILNITIRIGR